MNVEPASISPAPESSTQPVAESHRRALVHEAITMALYISISLVAVMLALPVAVGPEASSAPAVVVLLTAIGLLVAHVAAFRLSTRFIHRGQVPAEHAQLIAAQVGGGLAVTAVAVLPVLIIGAPTGIVVSELLLIGLVAVVGYAAARLIPVSRPRAVIYALAVVAVALAVLWVKSLVPH